MIMTTEMKNGRWLCLRYQTAIIVASLTCATSVVIENFSITNNKAPIKGDAIQLTCKYNENGTWSTSLFIYKPGSEVSVCACYESSCTKPNPSVKCSHDESALKVLVDINQLDDSDYGDWKCKVEHSFKEVSLLVRSPVTSVMITSPSTNPIPVTENRPAEFHCTTSVERPRSIIQWYFKNNGSHLTGGTVSSSDDTALESTVGTLRHSFHRSDNGKELYCTARNIDGRTPVKSTNSKQIYVRYAPDAGPFIVSFTNNSTYKMIQSVQQTMICYVTGGNPTPSLTWNCYSGSQANISGSGEVRKSVSWTTSNQSPGTCTCTMDQVISGKQSVVLNIQVLYPPTIPTFSANGTVFDTTLREIQGRSVEVICSSSSQPSPSSYQWTNMIGGSVSNSRVLRLDNVQTSSVGSYRCNVSNTMEPSVGNEMPGSSTAYFSLVMLSPPTPPVLSYKSESVTNQLSVVQGDNVAISCTSSSEPAPSYLWTGPKRSWNSQIIMNNIQTSKTGKYTCEVTNNMNPSVGPVVVGNRQTVISITVMKKPTVPSFLYIPQLGASETFSGSTLAVITGTNFSIKCFGSSSIPNPLYNWTGLVTSTTDTVIFNNINTDKHGNYTCHVTNVMNRTVGSTAIGRNNKQLAVNVLYSPEITPLADRNLTEYDDLNILCSANSNPSPNSYSWTSSEDNFRQTSPSLTKTNVTRHDTAVYTCTVRNQMVPTIGRNNFPGEKSISVSIRVLYHPDVTISQPNGTDIKEGDENVVLLCNADGDPYTFVFTNWTQYAPDGKTIVKEYKPIEGSKGEVVLTFPTVSYMDSGIFEIQASNGVPERQTAELYASRRVSQLVKGKPYVTDSKKSIDVVIGDSVQVNVSFYSNDGSEAVVNWFKVLTDSESKVLTSNEHRYRISTFDDDVSVFYYGIDVMERGKTTQLSIYNVKVEDLTAYKVKISNTIGTVDYTVTLSQIGPPYEPYDVSLLTEYVTSSSITLAWYSGFNGGAEQTFYILYKESKATQWQKGKAINGDKKIHSRFTGTISGLKADTSYTFRIYSQNVYGSRNSTFIIYATTTKAKVPVFDGETSNPGAVAGGIAAGVLGLVIIGSLVLLWLRKKGRLPDCRNKNKRKTETKHSRLSSFAVVNADNLDNTRSSGSVYDVLKTETEAVHMYEVLQGDKAQQNKRHVDQQKVEIKTYDNLSDTNRARENQGNIRGNASSTSSTQAVIYSNLKLTGE